MVAAILDGLRRPFQGHLNNATIRRRESCTYELTQKRTKLCKCWCKACICSL